MCRGIGDGVANDGELALRRDDTRLHAHASCPSRGPVYDVVDGVDERSCCWVRRVLLAEVKVLLPTRL